ncbi:MAG: adenylosuccinate lyase [Chitinophagales bacterium]|nr:adenylosuccinate lyase [Chitinophagales bacterium]
MKIASLKAISPIDGRYADKVTSLSAYFSEFALIKYRVIVEIEYFIALSKQNLAQLSVLTEEQEQDLRSIYEKFSEEDALEIKEIEKTTNHDVKAVEYFLKKKWDALGMASSKEFIHFGLTSQDINNTAFPLMLREADEAVLIPALKSLVGKLEVLAKEWESIPMLARTHGQAASPTKLGKEIMVFIERITNQADLLEELPIAGKFGGATGNFNAHHVAYPEMNWVEFGNSFVEEILGLYRYQYTTQIEHYDFLAAYFDNWKRIDTILIDFCRDMWTYVSMDYFKQKIKAGEIGSSAMPHKVNPIDFENAEGNLGIANALFEHFSAKLPISRLQRDLTDSTVLRNIGVPLAHALLSMQAIEKGLDKLLINKEKIEEDLEKNWMVVAEAIQTVLRREGIANPYEQLKELTRTNEKVGQKEIHAFIDKLDIAASLKDELKNISPSNYYGVF